LRSYEGCGHGRYPHLGPDDRKVWESFLDAGVLDFRKAYYDVRLGGRSADACLDAVWQRKLYEMLSCKRVDVVLEGGFGWLVCEVKPIGSMSGLGQALTYTDLFKAEFLPSGLTAGAVLCRDVDADILPVCRRLLVQVWTPAGRVV